MRYISIPFEAATWAIYALEIVLFRRPIGRDRFEKAKKAIRESLEAEKAKPDFKDTSGLEKGSD